MAPVGFFDSGVGGLCILEAFKRMCPNESTVYIADSANCPYGNKPADEIRRLSLANARTLIDKYGCKMIVVACNTATAAAIDALRRKWPEIPFVGLEPAVKPAALRSKSGVVGVLATAGTFNGRLYNETKAKFAKGVTVLATVADEWVVEVEKLGGKTVESLSAREYARVEKIVSKLVEPLLAAGADKLVLGCTHFPHLKSVIEKIAQGRAEVIDPSDAVARQAKRILRERFAPTEKPSVPTHVFLKTPSRFSNQTPQTSQTSQTSQHMIKALVFDFGGVMTTCATPVRVREIVEANGLPWQAVLDGFRNHRRAYDLGDITVREFYDLTWRDAGVSVPGVVQAEIDRADTASFLYRNERTLAWMRDLKAHGYRIGILTNMPRELAPLFKRHFADFIELSEATVISSEEHLVKPMREIYDVVRERLGVAADEICFFDDSDVNCRGAEDAGWHAIRFENVDRAGAALEEMTRCRQLS